jgi:hypothetical protein
VKSRLELTQTSLEEFDYKACVLCIFSPHSCDLQTRGADLTSVLFSSFILSLYIFHTTILNLWKESLENYLISRNMEALLRQSKAMCPFLKATSPQALRKLSTTAAPAVAVSPGGGSLSNLQLLARRCPLMGKAMTVQSARYGKVLAKAYGGVVVKQYHSKVGGNARTLKEKGI